MRKYPRKKKQQVRHPKATTPPRRRRRSIHSRSYVSNSEDSGPNLAKPSNLSLASSLGSDVAAAGAAGEMERGWAARVVGGSGVVATHHGPDRTL